MRDFSQDLQLYRRRNHAHRHPEHWLEILDRLDGSHCYLPPGDLSFLSRNRFVTCVCFSLFLSCQFETKSASSLLANRSLEDIDAYYRFNPSLFVIRDPDAICTKRPQKYIQHESEEVQKNAKQGTLDMYKAQSHMVEHVE